MLIAAHANEDRTLTTCMNIQIIGMSPATSKQQKVLGMWRKNTKNAWTLSSVSLSIFCLLFSSVDYVPVTGEIIWYLSLTAWLISLNIRLSSSIHADAKGISSFFLSAA